jgi:hypothetical protein
MKKLLLCIILSVGILGCGSENSGSLSVSAPTASNGVATATATYTPSSGSALSGQSINFRWYAVDTTSKIPTKETLETVHTDSNGKATSQYRALSGLSGTYIVYVIASTGDLTNIEGLQSVSVVL